MQTDTKAAFAVRLFIFSVPVILRVRTVDINVALLRPATQSSDWNDFNTGFCSASRAVDGNNDSDLTLGSCSQTDDDSGGPNWWSVDLGQSMQVRLIVITNRGDVPSCGLRLDYFIVGVTNSTAAPQRGCYALCGQYPSTAVNGGRHYLQCNPSIASGRYVIVQQPANGVGYLTLCEVEIYVGQVRNAQRWHLQRDRRLMASATTAVKPRSAMQCIGKCKRTSGCDSVNYRPEKKTCEMNFHPRGAIQCDLISAAGWNWWTQVYEFI